MKDTDYLSISATVRARENALLTRERRERMLDARSDEECAKVLTECGYTEPEDLSAGAVNAVLAQAREELFRELKGAAPQPGLVEVFQIKYDYHNAKVLIKAEAMGEEPERLLMSGGRYEPKALAEDYRRGEVSGCSEAMRKAMGEAKAVLADRRDPRQADLILDRACYAEMTAAARESGSPFLQGYVRLSIDAANLRTAVRCARMGAATELLRESLLPGGNVDASGLAAAKGNDLAARFAASPLEGAAQMGAALAAPGAGSLTAFERACDDALTAYLAQARRVAFGEQPVVGYLCAREAEATAIRTILSGRKAGLSAEAIRERLRESYV